MVNVEQRRGYSDLTQATARRMYWRMYWPMNVDEERVGVLVRFVDELSPDDERPLRALLEQTRTSHRQWVRNGGLLRMLPGVWDRWLVTVIVAQVALLGARRYPPPTAAAARGRAPGRVAALCTPHHGYTRGTFLS